MYVPTTLKFKRRGRNKVSVATQNLYVATPLIDSRNRDIHLDVVTYHLYVMTPVDCQVYRDIKALCRTLLQFYTGLTRPIAWPDSLKLVLTQLITLKHSNFKPQNTFNSKQFLNLWNLKTLFCLFPTFTNPSFLFMFYLV